MPVSYITIEALQAEQRIDNFLFKHLKTVPKSRIYRLLRKGEIRVNKKRIKAPYRLQENDIIRLAPIHQDQTAKPSFAHLSYQFEYLKKLILYEDEQLLVLNKPSGLAVHGGSGIDCGVIEALRLILPDYPYLELVHRLDKETSGCLMIAKKPARLRQLHAQLRDHQLDKRYITLLKGQWHSSLKVINQPLHRYLLPSGERRVKVSPEGKSARTFFSLKQAYKDCCLVDVRLESGRTHQIRVHAAWTGHPVVGDDKYGHANFNQQLQQQGIKRLCLHAARLTIPAYHSDKTALSIHAPLPEKLQQAFKNL